MKGSPSKEEGEGKNAPPMEASKTNNEKYPLTPEGLKAFLLEEIDGPKPLALDSADEPFSVASYRANSIDIPAGAALEIPVPVFKAGSKVRILEIKVEEEQLDIGFSVTLRRPGDGPGTFVLETLSEMALTTMESGQHYMIETAPATFLLNFDNRHSWITPKKVSYTVTVAPPVNDEILQRSRRAEEALRSVMTDIRKVKETALGIKKLREAVELKGEQMEERIKIKENGIEMKKLEVEKAQDAIRQAEESAGEKAKEIQEARGLVEEATQDIEEAELEKVEIERQIAELQVLLKDKESAIQAVVHEKKERENRVILKQDEYSEAEVDVSLKVKEMQEREQEMEEALTAKKEDQGLLSNVAMEHQVTMAKEYEAENQMKFLKSKFEGLQMRLLQKTQEI
eukprot:scaffold168886_cov50-Attheya_sp.AAC.1